jgi:hypothetical protein
MLAFAFFIVVQPLGHVISHQFGISYLIWHLFSNCPFVSVISLAIMQVSNSSPTSSLALGRDLVLASGSGSRSRAKDDKMTQWAMPTNVDTAGNSMMLFGLPLVSYGICSCKCRPDSLPRDQSSSQIYNRRVHQY